MEHKYYLAADGGGTKLLTVLYDENCNIVRHAKSGGTNLLFRPKEVAEAETAALVDKLLPEDVRVIESLDCSIVGPTELLLDALKKRCEVRHVQNWGEGKVALYSAGVEYGIAAQAGTGSDAFLIRPEGTRIVGGWGMTLGDEGGGYDIGLRTLRAAIYAEDGRGPQSVLPDLIREAWGLRNLWDMIERLTGNPDMRSLVASVTHLTERAALAGDEAALSVYRDAGRELAKQVLAVIRNGGGHWIGPVIASGGAWKGSAAMFETFREAVLAAHPGAEVRFPDYEPIVGSVVGRLLALHPEASAESAVRDLLGEGFDAFRYRRPKDYQEDCV